jgi:hypothetical protein
MNLCKLSFIGINGVSFEAAAAAQVYYEASTAGVVSVGHADDGSYHNDTICQLHITSGSNALKYVSFDLRNVLLECQYGVFEPRADRRFRGRALCSGHGAPMQCSATRIHNLLDGLRF